MNICCDFRGRSKYFLNYTSILNTSINSKPSWLYSGQAMQAMTTKETKGTKMLYYFPMILAICSNIFYHIFLKTINQNANPVLALCVTYTTATALSLFIYFAFYDRLSFREDLSQLNWPCMALGIAIVFLETGFILAYRAGWQIGSAAIFSNAAIGIILIPVGVFFFREYLTAMKLAGIGFCVFGLILINK
jgi:drug/metabolite transporter (DMT)-like permease